MLTLMSGSTVSVAIPIAVSPILTRIYSPQDFGDFGIYTALVLVLLSISSGKYEQAIVLPKANRDAAHLVYLTALITAAFCAVLFFLTLIFNGSIVKLLANERMGGWLYFVSISIFFASIYQALNYWCIRNKKFGGISKNRVMNSTTAAGASILAPTVLPPAGGIGGLILGEFAGRLLATIGLARIFYSDPSSKSPGLLRSIALLRRYKKFCIFVMPGALLNIGSKQVPILLFSFFYSSSFVGQLVLAQRVIQAPLGIISAAMSESLLQKTTEEFRRKGECFEIYKRVLMILSIPTLLPFAAVFFFAEEIFGFVFGDEWRSMGVIVRILLPFYYVYLIAGVLNILFVSAEKNRLNFAFQVILFFLAVGSVIVSKMLNQSSLDALILFSFGSSIAFLIGLIFTYKISRGQL